MIAAAFAVAFAVLVSSPTQTVHAQAAPDHTIANGDTAANNVAPGDTVRIEVASAFAQVSITGTANGVSGSFDANDAQSIACGDGATCDKDTDTDEVAVDLTVDADSGEGHILLNVGALGATSSTKVINVNKTTLVGSLTLTADTKTIPASGDGTTNTTMLTVEVKNASASADGMDGEVVTLVTTRGTISCDGSTFSQFCQETTANADPDGDGPATPRAGIGRVTVRGEGVEGVATITATLGTRTATVDITMFGSAKNLAAVPDQGSVEIGESVYVVLTVTDGAGNPVSGATVIAGTPDEVVGPADDAVLVVTEKATPARADFSDDAVGVGYSKDKPAVGTAKAIPACGQDNSDTDGDTGGLQELFATEGTNANGQCVVYVTAPEDTSDATKSATRGPHTLHFAVDGATTVKASATIEVAGKPDSITTDAPAMVDTASVTKITVSVFDDEGVLVGDRDVNIRKVGGDGLIEDAQSSTTNGKATFTFIAPSAIGSSEILISAGKVDHRLTLQIGEAPEEPAPPAHVPALNKTPASTGFTAVSFNGGSVADLVAVVTDVCGPSASIYGTSLGEYVGYFVGSPDFVNRAFNDLYADGIDAGEAFLVGGCGS